MKNTVMIDKSHITLKNSIVFTINYYAIMIFCNIVLKINDFVLTIQEPCTHSTRFLYSQYKTKTLMYLKHNELTRF